MNARSALLLSAIIGILGAVIFLGPLLLAGYGACTLASFIGLCNVNNYTMGATVSFFIFVGVVTFISFGAWYVFAKIPSTWVKLGLGLAILVIGILLFQPEIDLIGIAALAFAVSGDKGLLKK